MRIVSFPEADTPARLRAQVVWLQDEAWPEDPAGAPVGAPVALSHDPQLAPVSLLLLDGEDVVAALDMLYKDVEHDGLWYRAAGLSTVVTRGSRRGAGLGGLLVAHARAVMAGGGAVDVGLFSCDRPLQGFYERAGWSVIPGAVLLGGTRQEPLRSDEPGFDKVVMGEPFSAAGRRGWESFAHREIALYPGAVDRLW